VQALPGLTRYELERGCSRGWGDDGGDVVRVSVVLRAADGVDLVAQVVRLHHENVLAEAPGFDMSLVAGLDAAEPRGLAAPD
jgi:hypothetical protein